MNQLSLLKKSGSNIAFFKTGLPCRRAYDRLRPKYRYLIDDDTLREIIEDVVRVTNGERGLRRDV